MYPFNKRPYRDRRVEFRNKRKLSKEKDFNIGQFITCSWDKVKKELDKCLMLCANCHRIEHDRIKRLETST